MEDRIEPRAGEMIVKHRCTDAGQVPCTGMPLSSLCFSRPQASALSLHPVSSLRTQVQRGCYEVRRLPLLANSPFSLSLCNLWPSTFLHRAFVGSMMWVLRRALAPMAP